MKKFVVALALVGGVAVIAYASLSDRSYTKKTTEKQQKQEMKKKNAKEAASLADAVIRHVPSRFDFWFRNGTVFFYTHESI